MSGSNPKENKNKKYLAGLSLAAIGIVYGDIGTSPLYAFRESFHEEYGLAVSSANVLGVLSLIFWALILVISIKYLVFVLRADKERSKMSKWRDHLFGVMVRNQQQATTYFNLPPNRVVEMGSQVEL